MPTSLSTVTLACVVVLAASACGGRSGQGGPRPAPLDYNTLTADQLGQRPFYSVLEAVEALRPNWLSVRGPGPATTIQIYVDENHIGGLEILRTIRIPSVALLRHLDGVQATARYGAGNESGVILVTTRAAGR